MLIDPGFELGALFVLDNDVASCFASFTYSFKE